MKKLLLTNLIKFRQIDIPVRFLLLQIMVLLFAIILFVI